VKNLEIVATFTHHDKMLAAGVDLFEVCELVNWMSTINCHIEPSFTSRSPLRTHTSKQKIVEATKTAHKVGICQNRLWNLAVGGGQREEVDLPILMKMVEKHSAQFQQHSEHTEHHACTAEVCRFSITDSTLVGQLHKCSSNDCNETLLFSPSELEKPYERITWWLDNLHDDGSIPYVVEEKNQDRYMVVSHVWSDGTGGGVQGEGLVNRCLFNYFKEIAEELDCTAIWWDTICIPFERIARQKAISQMHENFEQAAQTLIHDQSLVRFPWTEDGSPCLALLLSTWFTRAWTSLELMMSRKEKVSVVFRHPNDPNRYTIKNLETDVLARHPAYSSRGHWIASSLVSQLRGQQFDSIGDILKVIKTKNTSWPRDLMVVAGLLTGHKPQVHTAGFIADITREIILGLVEIEESFLYHGHTTMTQKGGFSWCPFSLFDGGVLTNTNRKETVYVDDDGTISGSWKYRELSEEDAKKVQPYSFHVSVGWQIRVALEKWESCLLLQNAQNHGMLALLVVPLAISKCEICGIKYDILDCQYVGTVYTNLEWGPSYTASVRLGKLTTDPDMSTEEFLDKYEESEGPRIYGRPWKKHLHSIRQARKQASDKIEESMSCSVKRKRGLLQ
jgi:hypothetical protein